MGVDLCNDFCIFDVLIIGDHNHPKTLNYKVNQIIGWIFMPSGKKRKRAKIAKHKRKKRLRKNRHKKKK